MEGADAESYKAGSYSTNVNTMDTQDVLGHTNVSGKEVVVCVTNDVITKAVEEMCCGETGKVEVEKDQITQAVNVCVTVTEGQNEVQTKTVELVVKS